jgi:hypothetical protein
VARPLIDHKFTRSEVEEAAVIYKSNCRAFSDSPKSMVSEAPKGVGGTITNVGAMDTYKDSAHSVEAFEYASHSARRGYHWVPKGGSATKGSEAAKTQGAAGSTEKSTAASPAFDNVELVASHLVENLKRELDFIPSDSRERHAAIMKYRQENDRRESVSCVGSDTSVIDTFKDARRLRSS